MSREITQRFCDFVWMKVVRDALSRGDADKIVGTEIERLLAQEREPMECRHPKICLSPITVEYRDGTLEDAEECSFCVQIKAEREKGREILSWTLGELQGRGYSEIKPKHACGYTGNPEAAYCEFCDMWVKAQEYLDLTAPSSTEEGK